MLPSRAIPLLAAGLATAGIVATGSAAIAVTGIAATGPGTAGVTHPAATSRSPKAPPAAGPAPLSDAELAGVVVVMGRLMCLGECPIYEVEIKGDGDVRYEGARFVKVTGTQRAQVSPEEVRKLVAEFAAARFSSIRDQYSAVGCDDRRRCKTGFFYDAPGATLSLTVRGATHRIEHNFGCSCAPEALFKIEQHIDQLAGVRRWVGENPGGQLAGTSNR